MNMPNKLVVTLNVSRKIEKYDLIKIKAWLHKIELDIAYVFDKLDKGEIATLTIEDSDTCAKK